MWFIYAILSGFFASLVAILSKIGLQGIDSNLATAIRTIVVLVFAWLMVFLTGSFSGIKDLSTRNIYFLIGSGLATGMSWLFYFRAIQIGEVSKVAPVDKLSIVITIALSFLILKEYPDKKTIIGGILITLGSLIMIL